MAKDPIEAIFTKENVQELRDALETKGVHNTELLCYVALIGLRQFLDALIRDMEMQDVAKNRRRNAEDLPYPDGPTY